MKCGWVRTWIRGFVGSLWQLRGAPVASAPWALPPNVRSEPPGPRRYPLVPRAQPLGVHSLAFTAGQEP
jgi:hypothetical protein